MVLRNDMSLSTQREIEETRNRAKEWRYSEEKQQGSNLAGWLDETEKKREEIKNLAFQRIESERNQLNDNLHYASLTAESPEAREKSTLGDRSALLAQAIRKHNLDIGGDDITDLEDDEVIGLWVDNHGIDEAMDMYNFTHGTESIRDYTLRKGWEQETPEEKFVDFGVSAVEAPAKWGYNLTFGKPLSERGEMAAKELGETEVGKWVYDRAVDLFGQEAVDNYQNFIAEQEANGVDMNDARNQTNISTNLFGDKGLGIIKNSEFRDNSAWSKAGEFFGDIATSIALLYAMGIATAPMYASATKGGALALGALEGGIDAGISVMGAEGEMPNARDIGLGMVTGGPGGLIFRKLNKTDKEKALEATENAAKELMGLKTKKQVEGAILKGLQPGTTGKTTAKTYNKFIEDMMSVAQFFSSNRKLIKYTDDAGNLITGELPKTIKQTSEAIGNMKQYIYNSYNQITKEAGKEGARVNLNKVYAALEEAEKDIPQVLANPGTPSITQKYKDALLKMSDDMGTISIEDAQKTVQDLNQQLTNFFNSLSKAPNDTSAASIIAKYNRALNEAIDDSIDDTLNRAVKEGWGNVEYYRAMKKAYGTLLTMEDALGKLVVREGKKTGFWESVLNSAGSSEVLYGLLNVDPKRLAIGAGVKAAQLYRKYLNDPSRNISKLFSVIDEINYPSKAKQAIDKAVSSEEVQAIEKGLLPFTETILEEKDNLK